jgi:hypothetical protein
MVLFNLFWTLYPLPLDYIPLKLTGRMGQPKFILKNIIMARQAEQYNMKVQLQK